MSREQQNMSNEVRTLDDRKSKNQLYVADNAYTHFNHHKKPYFKKYLKNQTHNTFNF